MKIGDIFEDGGYTYEVIGMHELGYAISKKVDKAIKTNVKPITERIVSEPIEKPKYTKTQINRMSTADLEALANELDLITGTGSQMKKAIIEKLEL